MDTFETYRPLLFSIAYRMLGSAMDAEDMVQEAFVRYQNVPAETIRSPKAFLCAIVTRLCINYLELARVQRETYVGPWLPEPIPTGGDGASLLSGQLTSRDSISMAFLVLLESLTPIERAVFLLREVFDYEYAEIAEMIGREEPACRQLFSRAKKHITENRPRFNPTPEAHARLLTGFLEAITAGEMGGLMHLLAEDVSLWADGGGKVQAATRPLFGRDAVAQFLMGIRRLYPDGGQMDRIEINSALALVLRYADGRPFVVITIEVRDDLIAAFRIVGNPEKLSHIE